MTIDSVAHINDGPGADSASTIAVNEPKSMSEFNEFIKSTRGSVVALNFYASWAEPCKQMNQAFNEFANVFKQIKFASIDADAEALSEIAESFDVQEVPFFVIIRGTTVLHRVSGANPKALQDVLSRSLSQTPAIPSNLTSTHEITLSHPSNDEQTLDKQIDQLVGSAHVVLFMKGSPSTPRCGFSRQISSILDSRNVEYNYFDVLKNDVVRQRIKEYKSWPTFPQLYINGELMGGIDIVKEMEASGELQQLLSQNCS